jgi:hypothetical protein
LLEEQRRQPDLGKGFPKTFPLEFASTIATPLKAAFHLLLGSIRGKRLTLRIRGMPVCNMRKRASAKKS